MAPTNVDYWKSKSGRNYHLTQEFRSRNGQTAYELQMRWLASYLRDRSGGREKRLRLLDFGCGFGRVAHLCDEVGSIDYFGYDFSQSMVDEFQKSPPASLADKLEQRLRVGDHVSGCYAGETFDVLLTISVLIHNDEATARSIIGELIRLIADGGEILLIENKLVRETRLSNLWHGGCWNHAFASYTDDQLSIFIDNDQFPTHAIYRLARKQPHQSPFLVINNDASTDYATLDELRANLPAADAHDDPCLGLDLTRAIAELHDVRESLDAERSARQDAQKLLGEVSDELNVLRAQFNIGKRIRSSLEQHSSTIVSASSKHAASGDHSTQPEPIFVFNAYRDCRYSHRANAMFADVLTVFTQEWVGIRAASGSFPGPKLAITKYHSWSSTELIPLIDRISDLGIKKVVAQGLSPGLASFLVALRSAMPTLHIYGVWHGALAAWCHDEERMLAAKFISLADQGVYDRIHFLKRGLHVLHPKAFAPLLPNPVPCLDQYQRLKPAFLSKPLTCMFGSWNNAWKNMYANLVGAVSSDYVAKVLSYAPVDDSVVRSDKIHTATFSSRRSHFLLSSTCDLILNATIVDCHPMLELEGLAVGTPSLRSNLDLDFGQKHPYEHLFTVSTPHNPEEIKAKIDRLSQINPTEIAGIVADYSTLVTKVSFERYGEFLEGVQ